MPTTDPKMHASPSTSAAHPEATPALDALVVELEREFASPVDAARPRIVSLLANYAREHDDWRAFALFSDACYTRNVVARNAAFELLVLCWGPGHESPIHDHAGQDCWMGVLDGDVEELRFDSPAEGYRGPLAPRSSQVAKRGDVAFIRDEIGLHVVRAAHADRAAVSLHLYGKPYTTCNVYCPETGRVTPKALTDYSERGRRLEA